MTKINLLPWREERRQQRQKEFIALLGLTAAVALLLAFGVVQYFSGLIENQNQRNAMLQQEIKALEVKIAEIADLEKKKADLLTRKQVIEQLQADRSQMVHLFDELVRTIPDGVRLNAIKQSGSALSLAGVAQSNARVSSYMRLLEGSGWIAQPDLTVIEAKGGDRAMPYEFTLGVSLTKPKSETVEDDSVAAEGGSQ